MTQHKQLPIYKSSYDLLFKVTELTRHFPRDFKHSLGAKIRDGVIDISQLIFLANTQRNKRASLIQDIIEKIEVIELLLRLSKDMRFISIAQFSSVVPLTNDILKQANGWLRYTISAD